jgi:hypothetical protein
MVPLKVRASRHLAKRRFFGILLEIAVSYWLSESLNSQ